jgi:isopenicillin N synthase-like dioxygenase
MDIRNLERKGYVTVDYPEQLKKMVGWTADLWKGFCALPDEVKAHFQFHEAEMVGYEKRLGQGPKADRKETFDVALRGRKVLHEDMARANRLEATNFVNHALFLADLALPVIMGFAKSAERAYKLKGFADEIRVSWPSYFIRFIHYLEGAGVGDETATAHVDQSGFTPHMYSSAPGLQFLTRDLEWVDVEVPEGKTVIIPDMQMQLRSAGRLRATCHRVVATPETAETGRYSAVCFVQFRDTPKYDKMRYGRLQEREPGFNYNMPFDEFRRMFK